jgi:hypothetical protein
MNDVNVTTERLASARDSTTRAPASSQSGPWKRLVGRLTGASAEANPAAVPPLPGAAELRITIGVMLGLLSLLSVGGAILLLLVWQQSRASGVLTTQLDRTWDLLDTLQLIERWVAFGLVLVAMVWIALAALNAGRATGVRRNPVVAALSLPACLFGVWWLGNELVAGSDDWADRLGGWLGQVACLAVFAIVIDRIANAADSRHGPWRTAFMVSAVFLAHLQFLGGLSTIERADAVDQWGRYGAYLLIGGLIQVVGALAINESERAIEDATLHRYELRSRFSESLLAQASMHARSAAASTVTRA